MITALYVSFGALSDRNVRTLNVLESDAFPAEQAQVNVQGQSFGPLYFNVLSLTYDQFDAQGTGRDLDDIFPTRPVAADSKLTVLKCMCIWLYIQWWIN